MKNPNCVGWLISFSCSRIRLQEGFNFAHANSGIVNMVVEVDVKVTAETVCHWIFVSLQCSCLIAWQCPVNLVSLNQNAETEGGYQDTGETCPCVVQYIVFPPHIKTRKERYGHACLCRNPTTKCLRQNNLHLCRNIVLSSSSSISVTHHHVTNPKSCKLSHLTWSLSCTCLSKSRRSEALRTQHQRFIPYGRSAGKSMHRNACCHRLCTMYTARCTTTMTVVPLPPV